MSYSSAGYDGAPLAEQMSDDYLTANGWTSWRQYQQGTAFPADNSAYTSEEELRGGTVVEARDRTGSAPIPSDGLVVSGRGAAADWIRSRLRPGTAVEVRTRIEAEPALPFEPDFLIGGGPRLLRAGRMVPSESEAFPKGFYASRHPRTAIGVRADGRLVLAVVDGRQPGLSLGMSIDELAGLMTERGCLEALNLDGGGSTTMVVKGKVVNSPSDPAGERPVSDALLIFSR